MADRQGVELAGCLQRVEPSQRSEDLLADVAIHALIVDQLKIVIGAALLGTNEHGDLRVGWLIHYAYYPESSNCQAK